MSVDSGLAPFPESTASGRVTIDLGALVANWRTLAARLGRDKTTAAVLKADAYGIGIEPAARALLAAGCDTFFVALPEEGVRIRQVAPDAVIYLLDGFVPGSVETLIDFDLRPVLGSPAEVAAWAAADRTGRPTSCAIHVDTGMNRLGLSMDEARALAAAPDTLATLSPALLISHLACADTPAHPLNRRQLDAFRAVRALFPGVPASLANSAGIFLGPEYHFDLARPGIALYGAVFAEGHAPLATVATLEARILRIRDVPAGASVGYGAGETLDRAARIAILGVGYADGYLRTSSSSDARPGARVHAGGSSAPLVGRVSMDLIAIDVTGIAGVKQGDWVELFGRHVPVDEVAATAGTIGYELLTGLGRRYVRIYLGEAG
jgi:alanine racemase